VDQAPVGGQHDRSHPDIALVCLAAVEYVHAKRSIFRRSGKRGEFPRFTWTLGLARSRCAFVLCECVDRSRRLIGRDVRRSCDEIVIQWLQIKRFRKRGPTRQTACCAWITGVAV
jgi:hypothetical protein